jgi:hypothetical protein
LSTITLRLADDLGGQRRRQRRVRPAAAPAASAIRNSIIVNLPVPMSRDDEMTLVVAYSGKLPTVENRR